MKEKLNMTESNKQVEQKAYTRVKCVDLCKARIPTSPLPSPPGGCRLPGNPPNCKVLLLTHSFLVYCTVPHSMYLLYPA